MYLGNENTLVKGKTKDILPRKTRISIFSKQNFNTKLQDLQDLQASDKPFAPPLATPQLCHSHTCCCSKADSPGKKTYSTTHATLDLRGDKKNFASKHHHDPQNRSTLNHTHAMLLQRDICDSPSLRSMTSHKTMRQQQGKLRRGRMSAFAICARRVLSWGFGRNWDGYDK